MLIHQWLDQYSKNIDSYTKAKTLLSSAEFFDCGDPDDFTLAGDLLWKTARPPFESVVMQFRYERDGKLFPILVFVFQYQPESFVVFTSNRDVCGEWWTSRQFLWKRTESGGWGIGGNGDENLLGDTFGVSVEDERKAVGSAVSVVWSTFAVMGCSNVKFVSHEPSPALNKKRKKNGKLPLVSYKTLEIVAPGERAECASLGGTHASPRVHLRRGHIRQFADGRLPIWVQACVVGSKSGMVIKNYKVTPRKK